MRPPPPAPPHAPAGDAGLVFGAGPRAGLGHGLLRMAPLAAAEAGTAPAPQAGFRGEGELACGGEGGGPGL